MKQFDAWFFPDHEIHMIDWMKKQNERVDGRLTYQMKKYIRSTGYCLRMRTAIDVGSHIGTWSYWLARDFEEIHAFEPIAEHRECFNKNLKGRLSQSSRLYPYALGDHDGMIGMHTSKGSSGDSYISGGGEIPLKMLDDLNISRVDFIKLDCEGGELYALKGGEETIKRDRPVIIVEQKPGKAQQFGLGETDAVKWLESIGYRVRDVISGDYILTL